MDYLSEKKLLQALESMANDVAEIKWALQGICNNIALLNEGRGLATGEECMYQFPKAKKEAD